MKNTDRFLQSKLQIIAPSKRDIEGLVLDVGGGGEGVIGSLYGTKAVSVDYLREELEETQNDALKIVMDAANLGFLDETFQMTAFFYSLMYMDIPTKIKALKEAFRVLQPGGILEIWDTDVPEYKGGAKNIFVANLEIYLEGHTIKTSYGVGYSDKRQTAESIRSLTQNCGFMVISSETDGQAFHILASKL